MTRKLRKTYFFLNNGTLFLALVALPVLKGVILERTETALLRLRFAYD